MPPRQSGKKYRTKRRNIARHRIPRGAIKNTSLARLGRQLFLKEYDFVRMATTDVSITSDAILDVSYAFEFSLADVQNYTELTVLFDQFRIMKVELQFYSQAQKQEVQGERDDAIAGNGVIPLMYTVIDDDDSGTLTVASAKQHPFVTTNQACDNFKRVVNTPKIAMEIYKTAATTGYGSKALQWLDCSGGSTVPHYGLKAVLEADGLFNRNYRYTVTTKYWLQFKNSQ